MKFSVTYEDSEPIKITTNEFGYVRYDMHGSTAVFEHSSSLTTPEEIKRVGDEIEELPFVQGVVKE